MEEALEKHHTRLVKLATTLHSTSYAMHPSPRIITPKRRPQAAQDSGTSSPSMYSPQNPRNRGRSSGQDVSTSLGRSIPESERTPITDYASNSALSSRPYHSTSLTAALQGVPQTPPPNERRSLSKRRIHADSLSPVTDPTGSPAKKPLLRTNSQARGSESTRPPTYQYKGPPIQLDTSPPSKSRWNGNTITTSDQLWHRGQGGKMRTEEELWAKMERDKEKAKEKLKRQK